MVIKICEEILCSSCCVKQFDVIIQKKLFSLYNPIKFRPFCTLATRHSHQILLTNTTIFWLRHESCILVRNENRRPFTHGYNTSISVDAVEYMVPVSANLDIEFTGTDPQSR